jgi:hypothetical protein
MQAKKIALPMNFDTMEQGDVPQGRNGKHKEIVTRILNDLDQLPVGRALKVPLADLNRAIHKSGREVATATDRDYLYIWNQPR